MSTGVINEKTAASEEAAAEIEHSSQTKDLFFITIERNIRNARLWCHL